MKKYMKTMSVLAVVLFLIVGCAILECAADMVMPSTSKQFPPANPDAVKIYLTDKPTTPFEVIGNVSVDKYSFFGITRSGDEINKNLREQAASIGGDAIINVTQDLGSMLGVVIKMSLEKK